MLGNSKNLHRGHFEYRGETSIRITVRTGKKNPDGTYERYRETVTAPTRDAVEKLAQTRLAEILNQIDSGRFTNPGDLTYGSFLKRWFATSARLGIEEKTYDGYFDLAHGYIIPALGDIPIAKLTPTHIEEFYASLQEDGVRRDKKPGGLSASTIRQVHAVVNKSLTVARRRRLISYNPATEAALPPKPKRGKKPVWTAEQLFHFLDHIRTHNFRALIMTVALTGMRINEVLGLTWPRIDFDNRLIDVAKNLKRSGPNAVLGDTKGHNERTIPMDDDLYQVLRNHRKEVLELRLQMGGDWNSRDMAFPNLAGNPMSADNFRKRVWRPLIEEAGLPYIKIHGLRHTFATIMMANKVDPTILQELLGHHSVAFTLDEYNHPDLDDRRQAIASFSRRVSRSS